MEKSKARRERNEICTEYSSLVHTLLRTESDEQSVEPPNKRPQIGPFHTVYWLDTKSSSNTRQSLRDNLPST